MIGAPAARGLIERSIDERPEYLVARTDILAIRACIDGGKMIHVSDRVDDADDALKTGFDAGARAWPGVKLAFEPFSSFVEEKRRSRTAHSEPPLDLPCERYVDLYLACACMHGEPAAIAHFDRAMLGSVAVATRRAGADAPPADEVRQLLRVRLLAPDEHGRRRIGDYSGRGDLQGWVRVSTARLLTNLVSRRPPEEVADIDVLEYLLGETQDPEIAYLKRAYREQFRLAFADALATLSDRARALLRYAFVDALTVDAIGAIYGVHRATAARRVRAAHEELGSALRRTLMSRLELDTKEYESLLRLVQSQLSVSLERQLVKVDVP